MFRFVSTEMLFGLLLVPVRTRRMRQATEYEERTLKLAGHAKNRLQQLIAREG